MRDYFAFLGDSLHYSSNSFIEIIHSSAHQWPLEGMTMSSGDTLNQNKSHLPPQCCWREDAASLFSLRDWLTDLDPMISSVWQYDSERWVLHAFQGCQNFHYKHLIKQDNTVGRDWLHGFWQKVFSCIKFNTKALQI